MSQSAESIIRETQPSHPAPVRLWLLWFGVIAAPLFWMGQVLLNYTVTALACFPAEAPHPVPLYGWVRASVFVFDIIAILLAVAGGIVSYRSWQKLGDEAQGTQALQVFGKRARFMAVWGLLFSAGFLIAIAAETIASIAVPPCGN